MLDNVHPPASPHFQQIDYFLIIDFYIAHPQQVDRLAVVFSHQLHRKVICDSIYHSFGLWGVSALDSVGFT